MADEKLPTATEVLSTLEDLRSIGLDAKSVAAISDLGATLLTSKAGPPRPVRYAYIAAVLQWSWIKPEYRASTTHLHVFLALMDMAKGAAGSLWITHLLRAGAAVCGLAGVPSEWPKGHRWISEDERGFAAMINCTRCRLIGGLDQGPT